MQQPTVPRRWRPSPFIRASVALHVATVLAALLWPQGWAWWLGLVVANHLALCLAGTWPRSALLGANLTRLAVADAVALTFDDGPDPEVTPAVLELLDRHRARASFFVIGDRAERYPELVREIVRHGHRVENHTQRHRLGFAFRVGRALATEVDEAQHTIARLSGRTPVYFRPPAGIRNPLLDRLLTRRGLWLATWTRRGFDTIERDPSKIARRLLRGLRGGDVLLLHDGSAARDASGRAASLEALRRVLAALDAAGLRAVSLPDPGELEHGAGHGTAG